MTETVKLHTGDVNSPTALLLSGGLDSSIIGRFAREHCELRTYTISVKTPLYKFYDESDDASRVAQHIGSHHTAVDFDHQDIYQHFLDALRQVECPMPAVYIQNMPNFYLVNKKMSEDGIKVVLSGLGSDEFFGGHPHHQIEKMRRWSQGSQERSWAQYLYQKISPRAVEDHNFLKMSTNRLC